MDDSVRSAQIVRFGIFEADLQTGELHKNGVKVPLQGQPFQVCALLLEHAGELVTREELRRKVWPEDTFVDFEQALNTAIAKIRIALEDEAAIPGLFRLSLVVAIVSSAPWANQVHTPPHRVLRKRILGDSQRTHVGYRLERRY